MDLEFRGVRCSRIDDMVVGAEPERSWADIEVACLRGRARSVRVQGSGTSKQEGGGKTNHSGCEMHRSKTGSC